MGYLYLNMRFNTTLKFNDLPIKDIRRLETWDGNCGTDYKDDTPWVCHASNLNHVFKEGTYYIYKMVINATMQDYTIINESIQFAFNQVQIYIEEEIKDRILAFNNIQAFLDGGGYPV